MRPKNFKGGRCIKSKLKKCDEVARTYDKIQTAYAEVLDRDKNIEKIKSDNYDLLQVLGIRVSNCYLVSAYDVFYGYMPQDPNEWPDTDYLFIDSGGYEVSDSFDFSERNKFNYRTHPWDLEKMKQVYHTIASCPKFSNTSIILSGFDQLDSFESQLLSILKLSEEFPNVQHVE